MKPEVRFAVLEWAQRQAAGENVGLDWVDERITQDGMPFTVTRDQGKLRFRHIPMGRFLPPPMVEAAQEVQQAGQPTALEGLQLLFARAMWLIRSRAHFWSPYGPVPALLAALVEAYGIDVEIHLQDRERLARLVAHLPAWYPMRGNAPKAREILDVATASNLNVDVRPRGLRQEAFACRSVDWHRRRATPATPLTIDHGLTWIDHDTDPDFLPEDIAIGWVPKSAFPTGLLRLLPLWSSLRLLNKSKKKK